MNPTTMAAPGTSSADALETHREHLFPAVAPYYAEPVVLDLEFRELVLPHEIEELLQLVQVQIVRSSTAPDRSKPMCP